MNEEETGDSIDYAIACIDAGLTCQRCYRLLPEKTGGPTTCDACKMKARAELEPRERRRAR